MSPPQSQALRYFFIYLTTIMNLVISFHIFATSLDIYRFSILLFVLHFLLYILCIWHIPL